jgi:diketogulonate reductase-like aldo/keto reductase
MKITDIKGSVELHNGVQMPYFGLGVYLVNDGKEVIENVHCALENGYRHIDTAALYYNEEGVGKAVNTSSIKRSEIFITTKVWNSDQGYENTFKAFDISLKKLNLDYIDLYLVHWPVKGKYKQTWKALEKLYKEKRVRAIGVSNFLVHHFKDLLTEAEIKPMVNQMEFHPYLVQQSLIDFCVGQNIQFQAWSPLMQGRIGEVGLLVQLATKYKKTAAQIVLRWDLQKGVVTIPKSVRPDRIKENANIFNFEISDEDMLAIDKLDKAYRFGADPDNFSF